MKCCVMATLIFGTSGRRDILDTALKDKIAGKVVWGKPVISAGVDLDGQPSHIFEARFESEVDMVELFDFIKDKIIKIPVLKGRVTKHYCDHDEVIAHSCEILEEFEQV